MSSPKHDHEEFHKGVVPAAQLPPTLYMLLTNKSGGSVAAGDVVIVSTANDEAFTTTTTAGNTKLIGVAQATIANNAIGFVAVAGYVALVNTTGSVTRGYYAETSTTAKQAQGNVTREAGSFAIFLKGGTTPSAWLFGVPDMGAGGGGSALTVEEVDGSPTDAAVTKIVFPNGTLSIVGHVVTYTPAGGGSAQWDEDSPAYRFLPGSGFSRIAQETQGDATDATFVDLAFGAIDIMATGTSSDFSEMYVTAGDIELTAKGSGGKQAILELDGTGTGDASILVDGAVILSLGGAIAGSRVVVAGGNGVVFPSLAADPSSPLAGQTYFNTGSGKLRCYDGSGWNDLY